MKCHRWFVSETLSKMDHQIIHIINKNSVKNYLELPKRKIKKLPCDKRAEKISQKSLDH